MFLGTATETILSDPGQGGEENFESTISISEDRLPISYEVKFIFTGFESLIEPPYVITVGVGEITRDTESVDLGRINHIVTVK